MVSTVLVKPGASSTPHRNLRLRHRGLDDDIIARRHSFLTAGTADVSGAPSEDILNESREVASSLLQDNTDTLLRTRRQANGE